MYLNITPPHGFRLGTLKQTYKTDAVKNSIIDECIARYESFKNDFNSAFERHDYRLMAELLDDYRNYAKQHEIKNSSFLGDRTKYYSSILEELPILVVRKKLNSQIDEQNLNSMTLAMGGYECTIRVAANPDGSYFHEKKRLDFCLAIRDSTNQHWIPLIGLETKKYCDKTMFGTILETYKSLQIFRPRTFYGFLVEDEARSNDVVLNSPIYEKEFILCDERRAKGKGVLNQISPVRLERFVREILLAFEDAIDVLAKASLPQGG